MTWAPDEAVVITLTHRRDRLSEFRRTAGHLGFPVFELHVEPPKTKPEGHLASLGAYGNAMSHRSVLLGGRETLLVLEDDAVVPADFQDRMMQFMSAVPDDWEFLLLGGVEMGLPVKLQGDAQRLTHFNRTHAYVVRGEAREVAAWAALAAKSHWDDKLGRVMGLRYTAYSPKEMIVGVSGASSDIPDSTPFTAKLGSGYGSHGAYPPKRLGQRNDGLGPTGNARLKPGTSDQGRLALLNNVLDFGRPTSDPYIPPNSE